ncbi:type III pantothenate kinase [Undibacterium sp. SXout7W]|uniref:type III pantothenate kinase n=1 Tax=Undibacterium sp. SXout7W TaxID=3413049 RepID=UPI003BEF9525
MLLLIDAGNTRVKWGVLQNPVTRHLNASVLAANAETAVAQGVAPAWQQLASVSHADIATLATAWRGLPVTRILVSNVAGPVIRATLTDLLSQLFPATEPVWFASQAQLAGVQNRYRDPRQLGCDRFASAIAAHYLYPQRHLIVATCGTATTVDAVSADGVFAGGMILPGLKLMAESLARNTAQLPQVAESIQVEHPFADNTDQAIVSGCIYAQIGAIMAAIRALEHEQQQTVTCLLSGGAAPYLLPHLGASCQHIENLVLTGLYVVAQSDHY